MIHLLKKMTTWLDRLERVITVVTGAILGFIAFLVTWQVVARYLLHSGQFWVEELALLAMMWAALLGAAGCIWTDSHVRLSLLLSWFPPTVRLWILTLMDGLILWFAIMMIKTSKQSTMLSSVKVNRRQLGKDSKANQVKPSKQTPWDYLKGFFFAYENNS